MWKILAVVAAMLLIGAGYLGLENKKVTDEKKSELASKQKTLAARRQALADTKEEIVGLTQSIAALEIETDRLNNEKIDLDSKVVQAESELNLLDSQVETADTKLARARLLIKEFPDIEDLRLRMAETRTRIEEIEIVKIKKSGEAAAVEVENVQLEKVANELFALRKDQDAGRIRGEFETTIAKAYNKWGFVVVNAGNDQGVVHTAQLDVFRRGQFLCKLLVTQVEANQSVADIVPGSLRPGMSVQPGDIVVKAVKTETSVLPPGTTQGPAPTPDNGAPAVDTGFDDGIGGGEGSDPFGGDDPDPFGGDSPDPFGGSGF